MPTCQSSVQNCPTTTNDECVLTDQLKTPPQACGTSEWPLCVTTQKPLQWGLGVADDIKSLETLIFPQSTFLKNSRKGNSVRMCSLHLPTPACNCPFPSPPFSCDFCDFFPLCPFYLVSSLYKYWKNSRTQYDWSSGPDWVSSRYRGTGRLLMSMLDTGTERKRAALPWEIPSGLGN